MTGIRIPRGSHNYTTKKITATGSAVAEPCVVWWLTGAPSAATTLLDLSDGTATGTTKWQWADQVGTGPHITFDPPLEFETGLYVETLTDFTSVTFGYSTV